MKLQIPLFFNFCTLCYIPTGIDNQAFQRALAGLFESAQNPYAELDFQPTKRAPSLIELKNENSSYFVIGHRTAELFVIY